VCRAEIPRRRLCLAGAFTTRRGLGGSPRTSPCDHREETGLNPGRPPIHPYRVVLRARSHRARSSRRRRL